MQAHTSPCQYPTTYSKTNVKTKDVTNHFSANNKDSNKRKRNKQVTTTSPVNGVSIKRKLKKIYSPDYPHHHQPTDPSIIDTIIFFNSNHNNYTSQMASKGFID